MEMDIGPYPGTLYFIQAIPSRRIKIGYTTNPKIRLMQLASACSESVLVLGTIPGTALDEHRLFEEFDQYRAHHEWFEAGRDLVLWIRKNVVNGKAD